MSDDQTNPFTVAGMAAMMQPNKYTDPSLQGKPLQLQDIAARPLASDGQGRSRVSSARSLSMALSTRRIRPPRRV